MLKQKFVSFELFGTLGTIPTKAVSMVLFLFPECYRVARNPYDPSKITGGSSSGSAAVVAAGLCPVALGVDGGGNAT